MSEIRSRRSGGGSRKRNIIFRKSRWEKRGRGFACPPSLLRSHLGFSTQKSYKTNQAGQCQVDIGKAGGFERGLCLPSGTQMTEEDLNRVVEVIKGCKK